MASVIVPVICGLSGCYQQSTVAAHDCKDHPVHACTAGHVAQIKANRVRIYTEGERIQAFLRQNWETYAGKFAPITH